jgi:hypothetical protein
MEAILQDGTLEWAYESLRLYLWCAGTKWAHLPVAGGIYDQHPLLIDEWGLLFEIQAKWDKEQHNKRNREVEAAQKKPHVR